MRGLMIFNYTHIVSVVHFHYTNSDIEINK